KVNGTATPESADAATSVPEYGPRATLVSGVSSSVTRFEAPGASGGRGLAVARLSQDKPGSERVTGPEATPPWFTRLNWTCRCPPNTTAAVRVSGMEANCECTGQTDTPRVPSATGPSALLTRSWTRPCCWLASLAVIV